MKKRIIKLILIASALILCMGCLFSCLDIPDPNKPDPNKPDPNKPTPPSTTDPFMVYILKDGVSEYNIAYSKTGVDHSASAKLLTKAFINAGCYDVDNYEYSILEFDKEILIGATDRPLSQELVAAVDAAKKNSDDLAWGYAYKDGKLAFYANSTEALDYYGWDAFTKAVINEGDISCMSDLWVVNSKTRAEYEADVKADEDQAIADAEAAKAKRLAEIKKSLAKFDSVSYGKLQNFATSYPTPTIRPTVGDHPRVMVNSETLPDVIANLKLAENEYHYNRVKEQADTAVLSDGSFEKGSGLNYKQDYVITIEALAFMYLITGDDIYGYSAILHAFNFLDCINFGDPGDEIAKYNANNNAGYAFYILGEVYDWCYDLLTAHQKEQLVIGVCRKLATWQEVGCPPTGLGAITGHGTGAQIIRHWVGFAIAVADEYPEIYNNVLGRVLNEYIDAPNWYYASGIQHQGSAYGSTKVVYSTISEMLMYLGTGERIYNVSFEPTLMSYVERLRPDGESIRIGDDYNALGSTYGMGDVRRAAFYAATYYKNPAAKAWYKSLTNNFKKLEDEYWITSPVILLLNDPAVGTTDKYANLELVKYSNAPMTSVVTRSAWNDENAWLTYVNMAEAYASNHDHRSAGTFQIYYKGILAPDTGAYQYGYYDGHSNQGYGGIFDYSYVKQTISKNGLLIYNPKFAGSNYGWRYSGGQSTQGNQPFENGSLEGWLEKDTSRQTTVLGKSYAYDANGDVVYSYISGDITKAYDADTVDLVMRSTMSVATGDEAHPLMFIVYDRIISDNASYKKTFLLHTTNKPVFGAGTVTGPTGSDKYTHVNGTNTFYYDNTLGGSGAYSQDVKNDKYNGQLTTTTLLPENPSYSYIGGDGYRFWVNNQSVGKETNAASNKAAELGWGRVEICPSAASKDDSFLNVMYVSDAGDTEYIGATLVKCGTHEGAASFGNVVMFSKTPERVNNTVEFTANATGEMTYYVSGLKSGSWTLTVGDAAPVTVTADEGGMATFKAQTGVKVTLTPAS